MIPIRYLIAGTRIIPTGRMYGTSTDYAYDDYGSGWSSITEEDKRQCARRPVWEEAGIKPGQRLLKRLLLGWHT